MGRLLAERSGRPPPAASATSKNLTSSTTTRAATAKHASPTRRHEWNVCWSSEWTSINSPNASLTTGDPITQTPDNTQLLANRIRKINHEVALYN